MTNLVKGSPVRRLTKDGQEYNITMTNKKLVIPEWLFQKIAKENNAPRVWDDTIHCVFQETEKAYKVLMGSLSFMICTWIPKSKSEWVDPVKDDIVNEEPTVFVDSYEGAMDVKRDIRRMWLY